MKLQDFIETGAKSVDNKLPVGAWVRYPECRIWRHKAPGEYIDQVEAQTNRDAASRVERFPYVIASPFEAEARPGWWLDPESVKRAGVEFYAPLRMPGLFLEFATLWGEERVLLGEATEETVLDWVERYGVLGRHATYPTEDGGMVSGRVDNSEDVFQFVRLAIEAGRCLRLFSAIRNPAGLDVEALRAMSVGDAGTPAGRLKERAEREIADTVGKHLENETCERLYRRRDGTYLKGPGFHSLLGAMYLQMANLMCTADEKITFCGWCGKVVNFEESEPPPYGPKGTRRDKYRTRVDRKFCQYTRGVKDKCKNDYHADLKRKRKAEVDTNLTPIQADSG